MRICWQMCRMAARSSGPEYYSMDGQFGWGSKKTWRVEVLVQRPHCACVVLLANRRVGAPIGVAPNDTSLPGWFDGDDPMHWRGEFMDTFVKAMRENKREAMLEGQPKNGS